MHRLYRLRSGSRLTAHKPYRYFPRRALLNKAKFTKSFSTMASVNVGDLLKKYVPVELVAPQRDIDNLQPGDRTALKKVIEAARLFDSLYMYQSWRGNLAMWKDLQNKAKANPTDQQAQDRLTYFWINRGPWCVLNDGMIFIDGAPEKPKGANYYPEDMTKAEFEQWCAKLSAEDQEKAKGFFYVIKRGADNGLTLVPYSKEYAEYLVPAKKLLEEAASATTNDSLRRFLQQRAEAFATNEYAQSDIAWMEIDDNCALDITIGPYEVYRDELLNYKASFEAFIALRDFEESRKLQMFSQYLQEIENNLPIDDKYKNPKLGEYSPIVVVNLIFAAGDVGGPQTSAFNLPNDEKVVELKGSKRTMLKNVQEQKFERILVPIAAEVIDPSQMQFIKFNAFFTHILAHELMHGLGPHNITVDSKSTTVRNELQEIHSAIEEAKADITGLFMLDYLIDKGVLDKSHRMEFYVTFLAGAFRSIRFGLEEAHGKGQALQLTFLIERGGIIYNPKTRKYTVDENKMKEAVRELSSIIMTLQAEGNKAAGQELLNKYAHTTPEIEQTLAALNSIPVDIRPSYPQSSML